MADLDEKASSGSTKVAGADPITGAENYYLNVNADGSLNVIATVVGAVSDVVATGTITANGQMIAAVPAQGESSWQLDIRGTFSAGSTLQFEGTIDNTNWFVLFAQLITNPNISPVTSISGPGTFEYRGICSGLAGVRIRCSAFQGGDSISIVLRLSTGSGGVSILSSIPAGTNVIGAVTQSAGPWTENLTQVGGAAIALGQTTMSASVPVTIANNQTALPVSQNGTWTVQPGNTANTTPWLVTVATALPTGANVIGAVTQSAGPWTQNITQFGSNPVVTGTGASGVGIPRVTVANDSNILATQSGTWTVQPGNTANTTPWLVTDSADGPVTPGTVASKSILTGGQYNTSLPTLTAAQQAALQVDSRSRLIIAPLINTSVVKAQLQDDAGNALTSTLVGSARSLDSNVTQIVTPTDISASGSLGSLNATSIVAIHGIGNIVFSVSGTWVGTIQLFGSPDGGITYSSALSSVQIGQAFSSSLTANGVYRIITPASYTHIKFQMTSYTSGTANFTANASEVASTVLAYQTNHNNFLGTQYLKGATDNTLIGNSTDRLKVDTGNFLPPALSYDDMNVANGGIARQTAVTTGSTVTLYSYSGTGVIFGFILNLQALTGGTGWQIDLLLDGTHVFGATGINTIDLNSNTIYDIGSIATDLQSSIGFAIIDKRMQWIVPNNGLIKFTTSIQLQVKNNGAGGASQKFQAGLMLLLKGTI